MMKIFFIAVRLFLVMMLYYVQLSCMEIDNEDKTRMVWEIIIREVKFLNHAAISSLAVSKQYEEILLKTAPLRKQYFIKERSAIEQAVPVQWHKYGTAYGKVDIEKDPKFLINNFLILERQYLFEKVGRGKWDGLQTVLFYKPQGFFNAQGDFCVYGYGEVPNSYSGIFANIMEYSLCCDKTRKALACVTDIKDCTNFTNLKVFLEFPFLLEAFLSSSKVYLATFNSNNVKVFACEGVTIPKNYKEYKQYFYRKSVYSSFDVLPQAVKKAVVALYKEQHKKKKKKKKIFGLLG